MLYSILKKKREKGRREGARAVHHGPAEFKVEVSQLRAGVVSPVEGLPDFAEAVVRGFSEPGRAGLLFFT